MAGRWRQSGRLRTVAGTVAAIGTGVLLAPLAGLAGCAGNAAPAAASHARSGTGSSTVTPTPAAPGPGGGSQPGQRPPMSSLQISG